MQNIEPAIVWLAGICTAIMTVWGLIAKIKSSFDSYLEPLKTQLEEHSKRLDELQTLSGENLQKLIADHESLSKQEKVNELLLRFAANSLQHDLTGNHTREMEQCSREITDFIYHEGGSL